jgi:uncharacterized protein YbaP (TraB family)
MLSRLIARLLHIAAFTACLLSPASAEPPSCAGRDMLAEMRTADPAAHARVEAAAAAISNGDHIFWRIEANGVQPSYLLGTVHLSDDRVNALSNTVRTALAQAKRIALEVEDLSPQAVAAAMGGMGDVIAFRDGRRLDTLLDKPEFDIVAGRLEAGGVPRETAGVLRPWIAMLSLALTDCERKRMASGLPALDLRIAAAGKLRNISVVGLETLEGQLRAVAAVPDNDQLQMLKVSLKYYDRSQDLVETMIQRYLARQISQIWPFQVELAVQAGLPAEAFRSFEHHMVVVRNVHMRDAALPLIRGGGVFIAVGALHLPGPHGLVELFCSSGLTVTPVE